MSGLTFLILDCETTGMSPEADQVVELGFAVTDLTETITSGAYLVKASVPITPEASACHHLLDCDLELAVPLAERLAWLRPGPTWRAAAAYAAHNAPFDRSFLPQLTDKPWLDTLRLAKRYLDAPSYSNQALRYRLKLDVPREFNAHRAEGDCVTTAALLRHLLNGPAKADFERLGLEGFLALSESPLLLRTCGFGKHMGTPWKDVPKSYLSWILGQGSFDADVNYTAETYLYGQKPLF